MYKVYYTIISYTENKNWDRFGSYPSAEAEVVAIEEYKECQQPNDCNKQSDSYFYYITDYTDREPGDTFELHWSKDYGFGIGNGLDYYIRYVFTKTANLKEDETHKHYYI